MINMLRNLIVFKGPLKTIVTNYATQKAAVASKNVTKKLFAAACIERMPIVSTEMNDFEKKYTELMNKIDFQESLLSDHEQRDIKDKEKLKKKEAQNDDLIVETAVDFEEKCEKELQSFKFAQNKAPDSEKDNFKNINRLLEEKIILLVKNKETNNWEFPFIEWKDNESLRETAERSVENLESIMKLKFMGNAPIGVFKVKDSKNNTQNKIYFFKAQVSQSIAVKIPQNEDHVWVNKNELKTFIKSAEYLETIEKFILDF